MITTTTNPLNNIIGNIGTNLASVSNVVQKSALLPIKLDIFEKRFKSLGKTLDEYMKEIAFDQNTNQMDVTDTEPTIVRNEILTVFHKSKLNPEQLAALIITNNIYIENETQGDWTRLQVQEVEEEIYNMRHEPGYIDKDKKEEEKDPIEVNRDPNEQSFQYTKKIKQNFD